MPRFFNVAGPNDPERHYTLPVLARLPGLRKLIDNQLYLVIHAPRQTAEDDRRFAMDLGLLRRSMAGGLETANPMYREMIVRALASDPGDAYHLPA